MYGDPICIYIRDNSYSNVTKNNANDNKHSADDSSSRRPTIRWKDYSTSSSSNEILKVDSHGRLVVHVAAAAATATAAATTTSSIPTNDDIFSDVENADGITIRVAHEVELGPAYLDWLTNSLI